MRVQCLSPGLLNDKTAWITGGGISVTNLIFARFFEDGNELGISGIMVDKGTPGFRFGRVDILSTLHG